MSKILGHLEPQAVFHYFSTNPLPILFGTLSIPLHNV